MILAGIFVGGASRRMGGSPKGLLVAPDTGEPLVVRAARLAGEAGLVPCLVGRCEAYRALLPTLEVIDDDPPGHGPLGGLRALLRAGRAQVVALSCDLPHVTLGALIALRDAPCDAPIVAPRGGPDAPWEPLIARYEIARALPAVERSLARGARSLQGVLRSVDVYELGLNPQELIDWDSPSDITPTPSRRGA